MSFQMIESNRGKCIVIFEGYIYHEHSTSGAAVRYRCCDRSCKGAITISNRADIVVTAGHNHQSDPVLVEKRLFNFKIKERAKKTEEKAQTIITKVTNQLEGNAVRGLPQFKSVVDKIAKVRNRNGIFTVGMNADIPPELHHDLRNNLFFRFDSGVNDTDRIVIFSSEFKKNYIEKSTILLMDGTFKTTPAGFYQILTIHGYFFGRSFPLFYIFMKNKSSGCYIKAFNQVNAMFPIKPQVVVTDFEMALINSCKIAWPLSVHYTCLFHFGQSIWRYLNENGQSSRYKTDSSFRKLIRRLLNLAFVPELYIYDYYLKILNWANEIKIENIAMFLKYFERMYMGVFDLFEVRIVKPIYDCDLWNCFKRIKNDIPRTTNNVEAWNRHWNRKNEISHPNIGRLVSKMKEEEEINFYVLTRAQAGKFEPSNINYKKEHELKILIAGFEFFEDFEYLDALSNIYGWEFE